MFTLFTLNILHTSLKSTEVNSPALSLTRTSGEPCLHMTMFTKVLATSLAVRVLSAAISTYPVSESLKTIMYLSLLCLQTGNGPRTSMWIRENGRYPTGYCLIGAKVGFRPLTFKHDRHLLVNSSVSRFLFGKM